MLVSHKHRFIFVKTRKTAGTSVEIALSPHLGPDDIVTPLRFDGEEDLRREAGGSGPQNTRIPLRRWRTYECYLRVRTGKVEFYDHMPAKRINRLLPREWKDYYSFAVERNPYDISISAYYFARRSARFRDFSLSEFIASPELERYSNWQMYAARSSVLVDQVLRYDSLEEQLCELTGRFGIHGLALPRAKSSIRMDRRPYREVLSAIDRARIEHVFRREISHFDFQF
jgi:hypothetical protein